MFIPVLHAMKIPDAKAAVDKELGKLEQLPAWHMTKSVAKKKVIQEAQKEGRTVYFATLMDVYATSGTRSWSRSSKRTKDVFVLWGDMVKDDSDSCVAFTEQGSSAPQMHCRKVMDTIARLPWCAGQAADAVSACTHVKMEDPPALLKLP